MTIVVIVEAATKKM